GLIVGDPTSASPLVWEDSPYTVSRAHIQEKFGGVEPLIIVAEGRDRDAMKDPAVLRTMEKFQRYLERDRDVGYSFSLTDILRTVNMVFHELEPKWGVVPASVRDVGQMFVIVLFTYRSTMAGVVLLLPLFISNVVINGLMARMGIGININTLPLVTVGVGFGIDYGLYILSRIIEEIRVNGDLEASIRIALVTSVKAVSFTAVAMVGSTALWTFSNIRFNAVMGGLLAIWMF